MRPTTQKQASKRAEVAVRRHKALELKIAGHSDRAIARILDVDVSTAHRDVKNVLEALAREHAEEAANLRALLNIRYEALFHAYYDQAVGGDVEATKIVVGIMERVAKINGVIPDRSLVTVDQRALHLNGGEVRNAVKTPYLLLWRIPYLMSLDVLELLPESGDISEQPLPDWLTALRS